MGKIILPIIGVLCAGVIWIGVKAIAINDWNKSLVKQPQFSNEVTARVKGDSTLNAKIDTTSKRIDKLQIVNAIQHKDRYGNITYKNVN